MLLRLTPQRGGDGTFHRITVMNDTGSNILSIFDTDMLHLGNAQGYAGWFGGVAVRNANGTVNRYPRIHVQVQLVRDDKSVWIDEWAMVKPSSPNVPRLSGLGIRDILYLGTAPGNDLVSQNRTGTAFRSSSCYPRPRLCARIPSRRCFEMPRYSKYSGKHRTYIRKLAFLSS
jgi:hypothetical protein